MSATEKRPDPDSSGLVVVGVGLILIVSGFFAGRFWQRQDAPDAASVRLSEELDTLPSFLLGAGMYVREFENSNGTRCVALDSGRGVALDCEWPDVLPPSMRQGEGVRELGPGVQL